tara:strand:+ start:5924 stop:6520 length:597 start_codon:yes stop_codon:yes gene_type:complete
MKQSNKSEVEPPDPRLLLGHYQYQRLVDPVSFYLDWERYLPATRLLYYRGCCNLQVEEAVQFLKEGQFVVRYCNQPGEYRSVWMTDKATLVDWVAQEASNGFYDCLVQESAGTHDVAFVYYLFDQQSALMTMNCSLSCTDKSSELELKARPLINRLLDLGMVGFSTITLRVDEDSGQSWLVGFEFGHQDSLHSVSQVA